MQGSKHILFGKKAVLGGRKRILLGSIGILLGRKRILIGRKVVFCVRMGILTVRKVVLDVRMPILCSDCLLFRGVYAIESVVFLHSVFRLWQFVSCLHKKGRKVCGLWCEQWYDFLFYKFNASLYKSIKRFAF